MALKKESQGFPDGGIIINYDDNLVLSKKFVRCKGNMMETGNSF
jgi:hypothetical protein